MAALAIRLCLAAAPAATADPGPPPNILFIMADDLGQGLLPLYGAKADIATPNIVRARRLASGHGLHGHWRLDRPLTDAGGRTVFADRIGGYYAEAGAAPRTVTGKLGGAVRATPLRVARFGELAAYQLCYVASRRRAYVSGMTPSAWVRPDPGLRNKANLLRLRNTRDEPHGPLALTAAGPA